MFLKNNVIVKFSRIFLSYKFFALKRRLSRFVQRESIQRKEIREFMRLTLGSDSRFSGNRLGGRDKTRKDVRNSIAAEI